MDEKYIKKAMEHIFLETSILNKEYTTMISKEYAFSQKVIGSLCSLINDELLPIDEIVEYIVNDECFSRKPNYDETYKKLKQYMNIVEHMREMRKLCDKSIEDQEK